MDGKFVSPLQNCHNSIRVNGVILVVDLIVLLPLIYPS